MIDPVAGIRYYHFDQLGSTRLLTKSTGDVTDDYAYDAYGALLAHNRHADSVDQPYQYVGQLGYYAHWQEPGFGLMHLGRRFCAPSLGRFTQRDPIRADVNDYGYVSCDPLRGVDPSGLCNRKGCCADDTADFRHWIIDPNGRRITGTVQPERVWGVAQQPYLAMLH